MPENQFWGLSFSYFLEFLNSWVFSPWVFFRRWTKNKPALIVMPVNCSPYIIHGFLSGPGEAKLNLSKLTKQVPSDTPVLILAFNQAGQLCARAMVPPLCTIENSAVSGLLTNSILFCWLQSIKDQCKKVDFDTNTQSRFAPVGFNSVLRTLQTYRNTHGSFLVAPKFWTHEARLRALERRFVITKSLSRV